MTYQPKSYRKFLATSVAAAMVATVAAPAVFANETTTFTDVEAGTYYADAVNQMAAAEFIKGVGGNLFGTNDDLLRRDAAVLFSRVLLWDTTDAGATGFTDVPEGYYTDAIAVAVEKGVINGKTTTTFAPNDKLTRGEMAVLLTRALNLTVDTTVDVPLDDIAGHDYEEQIKAVYQAGLTTGFPDGSFKADDTVTRADFATFLYRDETVKTNVAYAISGEVEIASASAVDVNKVEVKFNTAVDTDTAVVKLTKGLANYNVTTEWNEAGDTVVITSVLSKLSSADYTVKVEGLTAEALTADVTIEDEEVGSVVVATEEVDIDSNVTINVNVLNQYGTSYTTAVANDLTLTAYESIADVSFSSVTEASATGDYDLKGTFTVTGDSIVAGDTFRVTAVYKGYTDQQVVTFKDQVDLTDLSFGDVAPLEDEARITKLDADLVVPYFAFDQYGNEYELAVSDVTWVSSNTNIIDVSTLAINGDGELTVDAGNTAGTAIVTAILPEGNTAQFTVTVESEAAVDTVTLNPPSELVAHGETVELDLVAYDQFGVVIPNDELTGLNYSNSFSINDEGKLEGVVSVDEEFEVTVTDGNGDELASVVFAVEALAEANTISAVDFSAFYEVNASKQITASDVTVYDQYGREFTASSVTLTEKDQTNNNFSVTSGDTVTAASEGTKVYTVKVDGQASAVKDITLTAVDSEDITSYALEEIGTIFSTTDSVYFADVSLVGKTAAGEEVVLLSNKIDKLTSSNTSVATINNGQVQGTNSGDNAATATIKAWAADGTLLGSATVTVSTDAPELTTIEAGELGATIATIFDAEDQYGVAYTEVGTWYVTNSNDVDAVYTSDTVSLSPDDYTVKFVSADGETVIATDITVN